jgi:hypothetical protein
MHQAQRDVEDFHRALDIPIGRTPAVRRPDLRAELIREEAQEAQDAILAGDLRWTPPDLAGVLATIRLMPRA